MMTPERPDERQEDGAVPNKFSELNRRGFMLGAAAALASSAIGCSSSRNIAGGYHKNSALPRSARSYPNYRSFLTSLRLGRVPTEVVLKPHYRKRNGVQNSLPPSYLWANMTPTLRVAEKIAQRTGSELVEVCSAYRSPAYNSRIGGASKSQHMRNSALDLKFACGSWQASKAARQLRDEGYFAGGVGVYSGFLHIDTRGTNQTWWG